MGIEDHRDADRPSPNSGSISENADDLDLFTSLPQKSGKGHRDSQNQFRRTAAEITIDRLTRSRKSSRCRFDGQISSVEY
jgi:hypothetical protein